MNKWDTIQADVADMYIGKVELEQWEQDLLNEHYAIYEDEEDLTLDWNE